MYINPQNSCEFCYKKILALDDLVHTIVLRNQQNYLIQTMQTGHFEKSPNQPKKEKNTHKYDCQCEECQIKFGSLPLLVQVIEGQESKQQIQSECIPTSVVSTSSSNAPSDAAQLIKTSTSSSDLPSTSTLYSSSDIPSTSTLHSSSDLTSTNMIPSMSGISLVSDSRLTIHTTSSIDAKPISILPSTSDLSTSGSHLLSKSDSLSSSSKLKPMKCTDCGKLFTHKGDMNKHLRTHSGEQPYACKECGKKFAHTSNLARHLLIHSGQKPFVCGVCSKRFNRKDKLQLHQKSKLCQRQRETD